MSAYSTLPQSTFDIDREVHKLVGVTSDCVSKVRFSPTESPVLMVGVTSWDSTCSIWQVSSDAKGSIQSAPTWTTTHDSPILDLSFSGDGRAFFGGCSRTGVMWNLQSNQKSVVASHDMPISCLTYVSIPQVMNHLLITGSWDGKLRWWDLRQQNFVKEENLNEPIFTLDAQRTIPLMGVGTGRTVHIYNLHSMAKVDELKPSEQMRFNFRCVACSPDFSGVAVGSSEGRLSFIRMDKKPGCTFKAHTSSERTQLLLNQTNFCAHYPTRPIVISGGGDGVLTCINHETKKLLKNIECEERLERGREPIPISAGDLSADGAVLAYAHSYDWALGKGGYKNQPTTVHLRKVVCR